MRITNERGLRCPRFVAVDVFSPGAFLLFWHSKNNPAIFTSLFLLSSLLKKVKLLTVDITSVAKTRNESRSIRMFGSALNEALRRTQKLFHRIGTPVVAPFRKDQAPRVDY